jgi:hypothetical protein
MKAIISEKDRMREAEERGLFDGKTFLNLLQATLHGLILDSTGNCVIIARVFLNTQGC